MLTPTIPIPEPLRANEYGTFTHDSVVRRLPVIANRTIAENTLDADQTRRMETLIDEIGTGTLSVVEEPEAPDAADWVRYVEPYLGMSWLDAPWFFIETYFYRRVMSATGYSRPGARCGADPFGKQKQLSLDGAMELAARLGETLDDTRVLVGASLWANKADLSLWPAAEDKPGAGTDAIGTDGSSRLLVDDTNAVCEILAAEGLSVHVALDNAGSELVADLALIASILNHDGRVTIHAKAHPTFVSDVTVPDIEETIRRLATENSPARQITAVVEAGLRSGAVQVETHPYWVSPGAGWECPPDLDAHLSEADLIIFKGDANYRRLVADSHWDPTTPIEKIVRPPKPLLTLRTIKAETVAGLTPAAVATAESTGPNWMSSGEWGLIHLINPAS